MNYLLILTFAFFSSVLNSQTKSISEVKSSMQFQQEAWNAGNIDAFMKYYWNNDSLKFIGSKGITYGWQKTTDNYKKSYPTKEAMGELTFTLLETTQLSKEYIYIIGKWALKKEKPVGGHFTLLWKKIKNNWVIIADHTS
jgi:ketosteroid isomerase-like protein